MSAGIKREPRSMIARLALTIVGALLMVAPSYLVDILNLSNRLQSMTLAGMELVLLVIGFALLYLGLRGQKSSQ
jgi:uncharacterized membrane protein